MGAQRHDLTGHSKDHGQDVDQNFGDQALAFQIPGRRNTHTHARARTHTHTHTHVRKPFKGPSAQVKTTDELLLKSKVVSE